MQNKTQKDELELAGACPLRFDKPMNFPRPGLGLSEDPQGGEGLHLSLGILGSAIRSARPAGKSRATHWVLFVGSGPLSG